MSEEIKQHGYTPKKVQLSKPDPTDKVKEFGKKARALLVEERQKRKEVKVLHSLPEQEESPRKLSRLSLIPTQSKKAKIRKQRINNPSLRVSEKLWMPEISHIPVPEKDCQSDYVKLHGLPQGCTLLDIKKFFTGLSIDRILLVLNNRVHIPELDPSSTNPPPSYLKDRIYYGTSEVRVLVKFESALAAGLAVDRSGETLILLKDNDNISNQFQPHLAEVGEDNETLLPFAIGVTFISKKLAKSLSKLTVDLVPGVAFHTRLDTVESKLQPAVREILWSRVHEHHNIAIENEIKKANHILPVPNHNFTSLETYQTYARHYNHLVIIHETLLESTNDVSDIASYSSNPVTRLTAHACKILDDEMDWIDNTLYQIRIIRRDEKHLTQE